MSDPVFFEPSRHFTAGEVALLTGAELVDPALSDRQIVRLAALGEGGGDALVYAEANMRLGASGDVAAVLCSARLAADAPKGAAVLVTDKPRAAFVQVARLMYPAALNPGPMTGETRISPAAHVAPGARLEEGVVVEAGAVVGPGVEIGAGTVVAPNAVIGPDCRIGRGCHVGPGATIQFSLIGDKVIVGPGARIGNDGFGYIPGASGAEKVPQFGRVIIQDRVEIGANTTIDRGAISDTVIGEGTKIDNLVQIAHNVRVGRHCLIAGHCGISGSTRLGDGVMLGGRVGIADHLSIGDGAALAAASGVMNDVPAGERWCGTPAVPLKQFMRQVSLLRKLARPGVDGKKRDE